MDEARKREILRRVSEDFSEKDLLLWLGRMIKGAMGSLNVVLDNPSDLELRAFFLEDMGRMRAWVDVVETMYQDERVRRTHESTLIEIGTEARKKRSQGA